MATFISRLFGQAGSGGVCNINIYTVGVTASSAKSKVYVDINGTQYADGNIPVPNGTLITVYAYNPVSTSYGMIKVDGTIVVLGGSTAGWLSYTYQVTGNISIELRVPSNNGWANIITGVS